MRDWLLSLLEEARLTEFTGRFKVDFRHGRIQHVIRTEGAHAVPVVDIDPLAPPDPVGVVERWMAEGRSGSVDILLLAGCVVEVQPADLLFPPKPPGPSRLECCPSCPQRQKLVPGPDYGNVLVCPRCGWQGTAAQLRDLYARVIANAREVVHGRSAAS